MNNKNKIKREDLIEAVLDIFYDWGEEYRCEYTNFEADGLLFRYGIEKKVAQEIINKLLEKLKIGGQK